MTVCIVINTFSLGTLCLICVKNLFCTVSPNVGPNTGFECQTWIDLCDCQNVMKLGQSLLMMICLYMCGN